MKRTPNLSLASVTAGIGILSMIAAGCAYNEHRINANIYPGSAPPTLAAATSPGDLVTTGTAGTQRMTGAIIINMSDCPSTTSKPVDVSTDAANGSSWAIGGGAVGGALGASTGGPAGAALGAAAGTAVASTASNLLSTSTAGKSTGSTAEGATDTGK